MTNKIVLQENGNALSLDYNYEKAELTFSFSKNEVVMSKVIDGDDLDLFFIYLNRILTKRIINKDTESRERYLTELLLTDDAKDNYDSLVSIFSRWANLTGLTAYNSEVITEIGSVRSTAASQTSAEVFIGLPQEHIDLFTIERIQNATGEFMEALGFELETQDEPVFGSFFQRLQYLLKGEVKEEINELYSKGKVALETQFVSVPSAEATSKLAGAAASLITALTGIDEAAIRLGAILVVKVSRDGVPLILAETVSPELALLLDKNPQLLKNPSVVFDLISTVRVPDKQVGESGSAEIL
ncbi:hypothetical protein FNT36_20745 [Hymenobacter setariae]|uniref:Uncharacterized protein n=1 Tax=Hymenobacter setariae TaxID=2594794 RepID=A0A558BQ10_9BACT|nr:hypothetical protein [Hymenobacter setariae]TVT38610.1 hypothetical protein FNT36_20745 [Hymenobacter setariae]